MPTTLDDLVCAACGGFVHPFLESCPGCGTTRVARYDDALAQPDLGFRKLREEPRVADRVAEVVLRYTLKHITTTGPGRLHEGLGIILEALPYAVTVVGPRPASSSQGFAQLAPDDLVVEERSPARDVARVQLDGILAIRARGNAGGAGSWAGLSALGRHEPWSLPDVDGDLVVTFAVDGAPGRLVLANRRGFTAAKARADHYEIAARGLGILAAAAAEARWIEIGATRHAAEIGLGGPMAADAARPIGGGVPAPPVTAPTGPGTTPAAAAPADRGEAAGEAIADALTTLEALRARGLVTETEYADKRREILARL